MDQHSIPGFLTREHLRTSSVNSVKFRGSSLPFVPLCQSASHQFSPPPTGYKGRKSQMKPRLTNSQQNSPSGLMGQHISARMNERVSKGMPPSFIELGNELIIVY